MTLLRGVGVYEQAVGSHCASVVDRRPWLVTLQSLHNRVKHQQRLDHEQLCKNTANCSCP